MLPVIALVGRPNVGKSTLFNQLTRSRDALVADQPGLTRDRQYGLGKLGSRAYLVIDTGGLSGNAEGIEALMEQQVLKAIDEADHILFLVDAKESCSSGDEAITERLRLTGKPITLVVNKSEGLDPSIAVADFFALGLGTPNAIAAAHGRGVKQLIDGVLETFPDAEPDDEESAERRIQIAVVGRPNVGKSTLVNRLLGEERVLAYDQPGTTRDSVSIPFERNGKAYTLIDTAGVRRRARVSEAIEKFSIIKTLQAIDQANVVLLVLDAHQGLSEQDATLSGHVLESGRAMVLVINKWDNLDEGDRERVRTEIDRKLPFLNFASKRFISALHGSGVGLLLETVDAAHASAFRDLATPELNSALEAAITAHSPPLARGRRVKLRYAHQGGKNPPIIVIHGNQTNAVPVAYQRYLVNHFRRSFRLHGTPIRVEFKSGDNPFKDKKNKLSSRQLAKRRRLKKYVQRNK